MSLMRCHNHFRLTQHTHYFDTLLVLCGLVTIEVKAVAHNKSAPKAVTSAHTAFVTRVFAESLLAVPTCEVQRSTTLLLAPCSNR